MLHHSINPKCSLEQTTEEAVSNNKGVEQQQRWQLQIKKGLEQRKEEEARLVRLVLENKTNKTRHIVQCSIHKATAANRCWVVVALLRV